MTRTLQPRPGTQEPFFHAATLIAGPARNFLPQEQVVLFLSADVDALSDLLRLLSAHFSRPSADMLECP
jgi:hypothetical protein